MRQQEWENLASLLSLVTAVVAGGLLAIGVFPRGWIESAESFFRRWSARTLLCFVLIPTLSLSVNAAVAWHNGIPHPLIHDEFSYLLAADTFAHGRLTNPSPPFFEHFETPHELMRPTRMSKYPPGQGIALMLGQLICGEPLIGAWISTALACTAIYWMLLAFVRLPWALLGGIVAALNPTLIDWSQVYWGGSVAVLGGAILLGAWGRLMVRPSTSASAWLGIGIAVLINSRPFEGMMLAVPQVLALILRQSRLRSLLPGVVVLGIVAAWMGFYNYRVTGHAWQLPFMAYSAQYDVYPKFWFEPTRPVPTYGNPTQQWVHTVFEKGINDRLRTTRGFLLISWARLGSFVIDNLKLAVLLPGLVIAFLLAGDVRIRWILISTGAVLLGLLAENFDLPHYAAPANPALMLLVIMGWAGIWRWQWRRRAVGKRVAHAMLLGFLSGAAMAAARGVSRDSQITDQQQFVNLQPALQTGRHLVFVEYSPMATFINAYENEFVFNQANLPESRIIWARYLGPEKDKPVAAYFAGRQVWHLFMGGKLDLQPYPGIEKPANPIPPF